MSVYTGRILKENIGWFETKIERLNKKAKKLGCPPIVVVFNGEEFAPATMYYDNARFGEMVTLVNVSVSGESPKINGWELAAVVVPVNTEDGNKNIILTVPDFIIPERFRANDTFCEHCNSQRRRNNVFVLHNINTDEFKQVGRSCIADFLGHASPESFMFSAGWPRQFQEMFEEGLEFKCGYVAEYGTKNFLAYTAAVIDVCGWVSRGAAADNPNLAATADRVLLNMFPPTSLDEPITPEPKHHKEAADVISYFRNLKDVKNDYVLNCIGAAHKETVNLRTIGLTASLISAYRRETIKIEEKQKPTVVSQHIGEVGKLIEVKATFVSAHIFEGEFGMTGYHKFIDDCGNNIVWKTKVLGLEKDDRVILSGRVKSHNEFRGIKETQITRAKIISTQNSNGKWD